MSGAYYLVEPTSYSIPIVAIPHASWGSTKIPGRNAQGPEKLFLQMALGQELRTCHVPSNYSMRGASIVKCLKVFVKICYHMPDDWEYL